MRVFIIYSQTQSPKSEHKTF